jgi:hypothetical protein
MSSRTLRLEVAKCTECPMRRRLVGASAGEVCFHPDAGTYVDEYSYIEDYGGRFPEWCPLEDMTTVHYASRDEDVTACDLPVNRSEFRNMALHVTQVRRVTSVPDEVTCEDCIGLLHRKGLLEGSGE